MSSSTFPQGEQHLPVRSAKLTEPAPPDEAESAVAPPVNSPGEPPAESLTARKVYVPYIPGDIPGDIPSADSTLGSAGSHVPPGKDVRASEPPAISSREILAAMLLLGAIITVLFSSAIFTGKYLSPADLLIQDQPWAAQPPQGWSGPSNPLLSDVPTGYDPWRQYAAEQLRSGHIPLWNPENMLGAPFIGNAQTAVFYPGNWIYDLWPSAYVYVLQAWIKVFLAALGTYLLARQVVRVGPVGALVAALTFALASYMIVWLLYTLADAALWVPWLWWASARLLSRPSLGRIAALALITALSFLTGHIETAYQAGVATTLFALFEVFRTGPLQWKRIVRALVAWGCAYALGACLAAIQILPFYEYLTHSAIQAVRSNTTGSDSVPWYYAWTLFSAKIFGSPAAPATWWGTASNFNESNAYCGVLSLVLTPFAVLAGGLRRRWLAGFLVLLSLLFMGMAYHWTGIYELGNMLPFMKSLRGQRMILVVQLALGLLAALGVEGIWQSARQHWWRIGLCLIISVSVVLSVGLVLPWQNASTLFPVPPGNEVILNIWQSNLARGGWFVLTYGVVILVATALWKWRQKAAKGVLALLPVILAFNLVSNDIDFNPAIPPNQYFPTTPEINLLQANAQQRFVAAGLILPQNSNLVYGLSDLRGYDVMMPRTYRELGQQIDSQIDVPEPRALGNVESPILNWLNVGYLLLPPGDPHSATIADVQQTLHDSGEPGLVGPIFGSNHPGQTFTAGRDNVSEVRVFGATYMRAPGGHLVFHLKDSPGAASDLATVQIDASQLADNSYWAFDFPPIPNSRGHNFYFYLESPDATQDNAVTLYFAAQDSYPGGTRMLNGQAAGGDLAFSVVAALGPDDPWLKPVQAGEANKITILENKQLLGHAWLVHSAEVQADPDVRLKMLANPNFNAAATVVLNAPLPDNMALAAPPANSKDTLNIDSYQAEDVQISTHSSSNSMLVLADQDFPGWNAYVDGQPATIFTADHALRSVYLPAGSHSVRFQYQPLSFLLGSALSLGALLAVVLLAAFDFVLRKRARANHKLAR